MQNECIYVQLELLESSNISHIFTKFYPEFPASALFAEMNDMEIVNITLH